MDFHKVQSCKTKLWICEIVKLWLWTITILQQTHNISDWRNHNWRKSQFYKVHYFQNHNLTIFRNNHIVIIKISLFQNHNYPIFKNTISQHNFSRLFHNSDKVGQMFNGQNIMHGWENKHLEKKQLQNPWKQQLKKPKNLKTNLVYSIRDLFDRRSFYFLHSVSYWTTVILSVKLIIFKLK